MKEKEIESVDILYSKVLLDLWRITFSEFLVKGKQSMEAHELGAYIHSNIDKYLNEEEKMGVVASQICKCDNEDFNQQILQNAAYSVAKRITADMNKKILEDKTHNNPYDPITQPLLFILFKFCQEVKGANYKTEFMHFNARMN